MQVPEKYGTNDNNSAGRLTAAIGRVVVVQAYGAADVVVVVYVVVMLFAEVVEVVNVVRVCFGFFYAVSVLSTTTTTATRIHANNLVQCLPNGNNDGLPTHPQPLSDYSVLCK